MSPHRDTAKKTGTHTAGPEFTDPNASQQPARTSADSADRNQKGVRPGTAQDSPPSASQALPPAAEPARAAGSRLWPAGTADHALGPVAWALLGLAAIVVLAAVLVATGVL